MDQDILHEQIAYYRARAQEYDETTGETEELLGAFARARELLQERGPFDQVLELACGTGTWTQVLLSIGQEITALDASPEMLAIAQQKLADVRVHYQQTDLFQWESTQQYHLVFFANWLSHVPPKELDAFLGKIFHAVRPGGYIVIIDQYAPTPEDEQIRKDGEEGPLYAQRSLQNGEIFTIVKVFYDTMVLQKIFASLGFKTTIYYLSDFFFLLEAQRS